MDTVETISVFQRRRGRVGVGGMKTVALHVNTVFYHVFVYTTSWFHIGSADVNGRSLRSSRANLHLSAS